MTDYFKHIDDASGVLTLAFVGGFIDAAGYLVFQGVFTSSITGNLVVAAASVSSTKGVLIRSLVCLTFTLASLFSTMLSIRLRVSHAVTQRYLSIILLSIELIFLLAVGIFGYIFQNNINDSDSLNDFYVVLGACLMGASMGAQNVVVKETWSSFPATTVMTSTLVNFGSNSAYSICNFIMKRSAESDVKRLIKYKSNRSNSWNMGSLLSGVQVTEAELDANIKDYDKKYKDYLNKTYLNAKPIIVFVLGAVAGAASINSISFICIAVPVALVLFLMIEIYWKLKELEATALAKKIADAAVIIEEAAADTSTRDDVEADTSNEFETQKEKEKQGNFGVDPSYRATME